MLGERRAPMSGQADPGVLASRYDALRAEIARAATEGAVGRAIARWRALREPWMEWRDRAELAVRLDATDERARATAAEAARRAPALERLDVAVKTALGAKPQQLLGSIGEHTLALWRGDAAINPPAAEPELVDEKRLYRRYFELLATATTGFRGERATLTGLARYSDDADRALRRAACEAGWSIFDAHAQELDELFDALVRCRAAIAQTCGFRSFAEVAVRRQGRTSYGAAEVARFRDAIRTSIVPFVLRCERERAAALGVDELMPWDESAYDLGPAIVPPLGEAALLGALREALGATHPAIGTFVQTSIDCGSIDVAARPGKAGGAFCVFLPRARTPFVVTNAAGVAQDVASLVHEFGHAFAHDRCREAILLEHALPANDVAEIHSMALEFLAEPQYECFFGASAQRYRQRQLASRVRSFPYIAAIDHFQELVYAHPSATAQERHEMWREMEARYLPWRRSGGIAFIERGGAWQRQRHVYAFPFYYVDYGLALYAALTLRREALEDRGAALERYLALCSLGGRRSFLETLAAAGIGSPFHEGALEELVC